MGRSDAKSPHRDKRSSRGKKPEPALPVVDQLARERTKRRQKTARLDKVVLAFDRERNEISITSSPKIPPREIFMIVTRAAYVLFEQAAEKGKTWLTTTG